MVLTLHALSLNEQPLSQPLSARFDERGGSIGRADHNTLALPDPERVISRIQAEISSAGPQRYLITNVSRANPIVVAGRALAQGETSPLRHRDVIRIGGYLIEARAEALADPDPQHTVVRPQAALPGHAAALANDPLSDPFADLLPPPASNSRQLGTPLPAAPAHSALPSDFDPFAALPSATPQPPPGDVLAELHAAQAGSIDQLFDLTPGDADPLADFLADRPGAPARPVVSAPPHRAVDPPPAPARAAPLAAPLAAPPTTPPAAPPRRTVQPPPRVAAETRIAPGPAPADPLWAAFCEAAGVHIDLPQGLTPEMMRLLGSLLRSAADGTQQLMAIRAASRYELRAQVTMIQARNNNPLKFTPDGTAALEQLLQPPMRGFLTGPAAMTDAMNDLVGHGIGTMAGMRAALDGVLDRFTPAELEHQLGTGSMLDSLLPMSRKARLWELYLQHFESIRSEAQEDFHTLYGKAFLAAYEEQLERLKARQRPQG